MERIYKIPQTLADFYAAFTSTIDAPLVTGCFPVDAP